MTVQPFILIAVIALPLATCHAPRPTGMQSLAELATAEQAVSALADSILAAARARDADRFVEYFQAGEGLLYVLNTRRLTSQADLREAFRGMLGRQRAFDPRWSDRKVQVLGPGAAVFTGAFRTVAQDSSGGTWAARGVVTFAARLGREGWRVVNWHTSEVEDAP